MGTHNLVTGLNGAGKTLYSVATKLLPLTETDEHGKHKVTINYKGREIPRRLVVGGLPGLALEHELMEVPEIDTDSWVDLWRKVDRKGGEPPVRWLVRRSKPATQREAEDDWYEACDEDTPGAEPVVCSFVCWWLWVQPGDFIVVDEAQRVFRPMASGRRVPRFIARLETMRHYGAEGLYLTQFPNLLHANVRALCGPHEDVQRIFGGKRVVVYLWERTSSVTATAKATRRFWKHDKRAFALYKSSELHTKFSQPLPMALYAVAAGLVLLLVFGWVLRDRVSERFAPPPAVAAKPVPQAGTQSAQQATYAGRQGPRFPVYDPEAFRPDREPLEGRAVQLEGSYTVAGKLHATFGLLVDGERVATVTLPQLVTMGYTFTEVGPCAGLLRFRQLERALTCARRSQSDQTAPPSRQASGPTV